MLLLDMKIEREKSRYKSFIALVAIALALGAAPAAAQSVQLGAGQVVGNSTAAARPSRAENISDIIDRALGSTRGSVLERGASGWTIKVPGTNLLPFVSNGAGADPAYQLLTGSGIASATVANSNLVNTSTTVNGQVCSLGAACSVTVASGALVAGTTVVTGGPGILQNSSSGGTLISSLTLLSGVTAPALIVTGSFTATGLVTAADLFGTTGSSGNVVLAIGPAISSPTISNPTIAGSFTATGLVTNADLVNPATTVNTQSCTLGASCTVTAAAGTLTGATLNATVVASSLTSTGTLTGGATGTGFTIAFGSSTFTGNIPIANAPVTASNTILANAAVSTTVMTAIPINSCSNASSALTWIINTGFGCNSSITANAVPAANLTGTTLASGVVTSSLTTVGTIAAGAWQGSTIALAYGGTNANLTANNGGIIYSTASAFSILAGTVTAGQCLLSGSTAAPTWGSCSGAAAVSSVADNGAGTLTISPTSGSVLAAINLAHSNTWTGEVLIATAVGTLNFDFKTTNAVASTESALATQGKIYGGAAAHPLTTATPMVAISRYEAITVDTQSGFNPALWVESVGNNTSTAGVSIGQVAALTAEATQIGVGDVVGAYFTSTQNGTNVVSRSSAGYGIFISAAALNTGNSVYGTELAVTNNTGSDLDYATFSVAMQPVGVVGYEVIYLPLAFGLSSERARSLMWVLALTQV